MTTQAVAETPTKKMSAMLKSFEPQIQAALPKHMTAERMARIALTEFSRNPKLQECDPISFLGSVVQSAQLGLEIGLCGQAYLVPFKGKIQLIPGYRGLMDLVRRSGQVTHFSPHEVKENDHFDYAYGLNPVLEHKPAMKDRGETIYAYVVAWLRNGASDFEVMSTEDIEVIRKRAPSAKRECAPSAKRESPWDTDWDEMAKKTVIRRLCKRLPVSIELQNAIALEDLHEAGKVQPNASILTMEPEDHSIVDLTEEPATATDKVKEKVKAQATREPGEEG